MKHLCTVQINRHISDTEQQLRLKSANRLYTISIFNLFNFSCAHCHYFIEVTIILIITVRRDDNSMSFPVIFIEQLVGNDKIIVINPIKRLV